MSRAEDSAQVSIVAFLRANGLFCFHIKNQGKWSPAYGARLNAMGRVKGMLDLEVITPITEALPRGVFMIEVKSEKGSLSKDQRAVAATLAELGIPTVEARSINDVERALRAFGVPLKGRAL